MRQDVESFEDFCQYYTHRFVKGRDPDVIYRVLGKLVGNTARFEKYTNGRLSSRELDMRWDTILETVLFGLPRIGTMVYKNELLYLYYRAERQGGRGYDANRVSFHSFNSWLLTRETMATSDRDLLNEPHFAYLATRNVHTSWRDAVADLLSDTPKSPSYAVSYNFGVFLGADKEPSLTYKTDVIGNVNNVNSIKLTAPGRGYEEIIRRTLNNEIQFNN